MVRKNLLFAFLFPFFLPPAVADTLTLDNGRTLEGQIVKETEQGVVFKLTSGSEITLPLSSIAEMVRSGSGERFLAEGDLQFNRGRLSEALALYRQASPDFPEEAGIRIERVRTAARGEFEKRFGSLLPDEAERRMRAEMVRLDSTDPNVEFARKNLARVLLEKGRTAHAHLLFDKAVALFAEAWELDRSLEDIGEIHLDALRKAKSSDTRILTFLEDYHLEHPDNSKMNEMLALYLWSGSPCRAVGLLFPEAVISAATDPKIREILPQVLRNCFHTDPYPWDAPLDRIRCYELYLELRPDADRNPLFELRAEADPDDRDLFEEWSNYLVDRGEMERAVEVQKRLVALRPSDGAASERLAFLENLRIQKEIDALEQDLPQFERPFHLLSDLSPRNFPTLKEGPELSGLLAKGKRLGELSNLRPNRVPGEPADRYLEKLSEYRTVLASEEVSRELNEIMKYHASYRVKIQNGDDAPIFEGEAMDGSPVRLSEFRGKVVFLYFWASWCPACKAEFAEVTRLHRNDMLGEDFVLIGVSLDTDRKQLEQFLDVNPGADWPQIYSGKGWDAPVASLYGVDTTPTSVLIDRQGKVRDTMVRGHRMLQRSLEVATEGTGVTFQIYGEPPP